MVVGAGGEGLVLTKKNPGAGPAMAIKIKPLSTENHVVAAVMEMRAASAVKDVKGIVCPHRTDVVYTSPEMLGLGKFGAPGLYSDSYERLFADYEQPRLFIIQEMDLLKGVDLSKLIWQVQKLGRFVDQLSLSLAL